ncbi:Ankyrin repeat [Arabidopsis suecica]|uniref:Ankyrin repeat n=1 Tax=Arabidopsis suecica TaxID=45249 RepID=A0A8T1ZIC7_ARASU|nr:Ankyrin repeat [Arabidopsis suecica]
MDSSEAGLDIIEAQRSTVVSHDQSKQRYSPVNLIKRGILRVFRALGFLQVVGEAATPPTGDTENVPEFFTNIRLSDLFDVPSGYVPMSPEIFSAVSAGEKDWLEVLRSYGKPMECLKSDGGYSVLHLAAVWGRVETVKSIVSECPCLLLEQDSRGQLPLHVAAGAGHIAVVEALVATLTFVLVTLSEEEKERVNVYVRKNINGDTPLHLALRNKNVKTATFLVNTDQQASFLANKDGISPLYMAVEAGKVSLVKAMLKTTKNDGLEGRDSNLNSQLEGRKYLVHAALKARNKGMVAVADILNVILKEFPTLDDELDEEGRTCLSFGASIGFLDGVSYLLRRSTKNVYVCNVDGSFPIHIAVEQRHTEIVRVIHAHCPNSIYLLNKQGQNILHIASKSGKVADSFLRRFAGTVLMEKQDVDGNTPLHLAAINWRPRTIFYLIKNCKPNCRFIRNNSGLTALDIAELNLQPNYIFMERVTLMVLLFYFPSKDYSGSSVRRHPGLKVEVQIMMDIMVEKKITRRSDPPAGDKNKDYVSTLLVVAALVATVTFAAGFTIPGGFNSSGPNLGRAILASDLKLVFFMVFDILAMQSSIVTIATLIWAQLGDPTLVHRSLNVAFPSLFFALLCMPVAFYCGALVAFAHVKGLVIFLNITFAIFLFLMLFVLGPHVFLQIPGIPAYFGGYFIFFIMLVDEDSDEKESAGKDLIHEKETS